MDDATESVITKRSVSPEREWSGRTDQYFSCFSSTADASCSRLPQPPPPPPRPRPQPFFSLPFLFHTHSAVSNELCPFFGIAWLLHPAPLPIPQAIKMPARFVLRLQESELACLNGFSVSLASVSIFPRYFLVVSFFPLLFSPIVSDIDLSFPAVLLSFRFLCVFFSPAFSTVFSWLSAHTKPLNPAVLVMGD